MAVGEDKHRTNDGRIHIRLQAPASPLHTWTGKGRRMTVFVDGELAALSGFVCGTSPSLPVHPFPWRSGGRQAWVWSVPSPPL